MTLLDMEAAAQEQRALLPGDKGACRRCSTQSSYRRLTFTGWTSGHRAGYDASLLLPGSGSVLCRHLVEIDLSC
jgi:hypothetical protein